MPREYRDYYDAVKRQQEMQELYDEISSMNEVIKSVNIRIHSFAKTYAELEQANEAIIKSMETDSYRTAIFLNEAEREWKSMFQPATKQDEEPHAMKGLPLKATLAGCWKRLSLFLPGRLDRGFLRRNGMRWKCDL